MKQIKVNDKCTGCGLCVVESSYLKENAEGNAEAIPGMAIKETDLQAVEELVKGCPEKALEIIENSSTSSKGKEGAKDIIKALKKKCDAITVKKITNTDVKLNVDRYYIPVPSSRREYDRSFSSESSARSAARDEFSKLCYSESAYRPILKKIFVEYKVNVLKPYYTCTDQDDSVYFSYNQQVRNILANTYAELKDVLGGECKLSESWKDFSVYLRESDNSLSGLKAFEARSTNSGIIAALKDLSGTSLDSYVSDMDFDYDEQYVGEGIFGTKYKKVWYFSGFNSAARSYIDDLTWAIGHMSSDIEDGAVDLVNYALECFEKELKNAMNKKIEELEKSVG